MSYNLDVLTDEPGVGSEPSTSSARREKRADASNDNPDNPRGGKTSGSAGTQRGGVTYPTLTRHIVFFLLFVASGIVTFLYREEIIKNVGYGALPLGLWGALFSYLLINRTGWLIRRYRETISSLVVVVGGVTVLGIFDAPLGSPAGATMGGRLGEILAREPFDWHRYDLVLWQQALAWVRAGVLFTVGAAAQFPNAFGAFLKVFSVGALMVFSSSVGLFMMAGGAAASIASKRNKNDSKSHPVVDELPGTSAAEPIREDAVPQHRESAHDYLATSGDYDLGGDLVVGMGDTIFVDDDDREVSYDVEDAFSNSIATTLEESRTAIKDDGFGDFFEVGTSLANEQPHDEPAVDLGAEAADDEYQSVIEHDPQSTESDPPLVETEHEEGATTSITPDAEETLRMITSGAAIEAAMNAFPWHLPPIEFLAEPPKGGVASAEIRATSDLIEETLAEHSVSVSVDQVRVGPTVTKYGLKPGWKSSGAKSNSPAQRVRVDTILNREKDIALALSSPNIRFESVVPGSSFVGIEVPNAKPTPVNLRTVMDSQQWADYVDDAALPVPLGMGSGGDPVMADLSKMPHTLVAGATGSGKSVCMNTIVTGLLLTRTPVDLRMVMIDPKRVELTPYQGVPHLYTPVIVDPERAVKALKALVKEMMDRFSTLEAAGVKNIISYNEKSNFKMPYLLILVDELADLMLTASNDVEQLLVRLAQLGRATGVHLVVATQRPSVDVVTGLIKANFPSRISFAVGSQVDSRTILDAAGADRLLGKGDMLYKPIDLSQPVRVQGAFLAEEEIETVVDFWKQVGAPPLPQLDADEDADEGFSMPGFSDESGDTLFMQASSMAKSQKTLSTSLLQRRLRIGYPRAARLMDELEEAGIVGPGEPGKPRQVMTNA